MDLKRYSELKDQIESLQRRAERAKGALDVAKEQLYTEFGLTTIEQAEKKLNETKKVLSKINENSKKLIEMFVEKWTNKLEIKK